MKKRKNSVFNSPVAGMLLAIATNALVIAIVVMLNRYSKIYSRLYFEGVLVAVLLTLIINMMFLLGYVKRKKLFRVLFVLLSFVLTVLLGLSTWYVYRGNSSIDKIINDMAVEDIEYSLISLNPNMELNNLYKEKIALVQDTEGTLEKEVKNELSKYSDNLEYLEYKSYRDLLMAAMDEEYELMVVPRDFRKILDNPKDEELFIDSKVLLSFNKRQNEDVSDVDVLKDPFTVLMLGNNEGLSDSIILASFNPQTLRLTMTSLSRDSYVPISCYPNGSRDKLNHSRAHSRQCIIDTVEDFLDVEVDFYFETDFYALVKIVDTLGGLELDSPIEFSGSLPLEDSPGKYEQIKVEKGRSLMNGKQAITFARERHHMPNGDFDRQLNQQYVIKELAQKILSTRNIETLMDVLDVAKDNIVMNIPVESISALMGYSLEQSNLSPVSGLDTFRIVQSQVAGTTPLINGMSVVMPYLSDIEKSHQLITSNTSKDFSRNNETYFSFSYKNPYKLVLADPDMAGAADATLGSSSIFTMPSFYNWSMSDIKDWGRRHGIIVVIDEVTGMEAGQVLSQKPAEGSLNQKPQEVYIRYTVDKVTESPSSVEDSSNELVITIPSLIDKPRESIQAWVNDVKAKYDVDVVYQVSELNDSSKEDNIITGQSLIGEHKVRDTISIHFDVNKNDGSDELDE